MRSGTTALTECAREIFDRLGYTVSVNGGTLSAVRGWKEVRVTPVDGAVDAPEDGTFHCFVGWHEEVAAIRDAIATADPDYEWAVIGVERESDGEYEVAART